MSNFNENQKGANSKSKIESKKKGKINFSEILNDEEILQNNSQKYDLIDELQIENSQEHLLSKEVPVEKTSIWKLNIKPNESIVNVSKVINEKLSQKQYISEKSQSDKLIQQNDSIKFQTQKLQGKLNSSSDNQQLDASRQADDQEINDKKQAIKMSKKQDLNDNCTKKFKSSNQNNQISQKNKFIANNNNTDNLNESNEISKDTSKSCDNSDESSCSQSQNVDAYVTKTYGDSLPKNEVDNEIAQCIKLAKEGLAKKAKMNQQKAQKMKNKYPRLFCIVHKKLYETEEKYAMHTIRHHPDIAQEENLTQFKCLKCLKTFITYGWWEKHALACQGLRQKLADLSNENKKLFLLGLSMKNAQ